MQLLLLVFLVLAVVGLLMLRRPVFARMSLRNIVRRKRYTVIVVVGLMIATSMISGSLVVGDTMDHLVRQEVYTSTGAVDIVITVEDEVGEWVYFNQSVADSLVASLEAGDLPHVDDIAPAIRERVSAVNPRLSSSSPTATLFGYDPSETVNELLLDDGSEVPSDMVTDGKCVINADLADELDAVVGDTLMVVPDTGIPSMLTVSAIAKDEGMARFDGTSTVFVDLSYVQDSVLFAPGMINRVDLSAAGSAEDGYLVTDEAMAEVLSVIPEGPTYFYDTIKKDGIEQAEQVSDQISQIFIIMSSFAIIAGVALIINIFVMLAEERKPEMGISRAVGMQRGDLTQTFLFEGVVYALMASAVGAFVGLLIAAFMVLMFSAIMSTTAMTVTLSFEWGSLLVAACAGFLLTVLTVSVASWRVSKLNIVRAIRDIPEPMLTKSEKKHFATGVLAVVFGVILTLMGDASDQASGILAGPSLIAFGLALIAVRFVSPRVAFSLVGLFMIFWVLDPFSVDLPGRLFGDTGGGMEMFIVTGVVLVTGGVMVIMFNSDLLLEGLMRVFGRRKSLLPVFKAAISYPMNKKFRTALTLFIFSLIMFTVVVVMMIASFQRESVETLTESYSGGFDVIGYTFRDMPEENLTAGMAAVEQAVGADDAIERAEYSTTATAMMLPEGGNETETVTLVGYSGSMLLGNQFSLAERSTWYDSDESAWRALLTNDSVAMIDGSVLSSMFSMVAGGSSVNVGDEVMLTSLDGATKNVTIIGIMDQMFVRGIFMSSSFVAEFSPDVTTNLFYFSIDPPAGYTVADVAEQLERTFIEYGMITIVVKDTIEEVMQMSSSIMQLMEIFLGVGLIVGIAGLGIITIRNIAERRQEIGVMRAIGYQREMILNVFMIETAFVALLGIVLGLVMGLGLSYRLWEWGGFNETAPFVIPWFEVITIVGIAFAATLLSTLPPSRKAARLAPAEALRRID